MDTSQLLSRLGAHMRLERETAVEELRALLRGDNAPALPEVRLGACNCFRDCCGETAAGEATASWARRQSWEVRRECASSI